MITIAGCGGGDAMTAADMAPAATTILYAPELRRIDAWPDDWWTVDEKASPTGVRVAIVPGENLALPAEAARFKRLFADLSTLDGFGTTSSLFVRADGAVDPASLDEAVLLLDIDQVKLVEREIAVVAESMEDPSSTIVVTPVAPLRPKGHYGLAVTTRARDAKGRPLAPSPTTRELLADKRPPSLRRLWDGRVAGLYFALHAMGKVRGPDDLALAITFTTQHTVDDSAAIAADIKKRAPRYASVGTCTMGQGAPYRACEGTMAAWDYREGHRYVDEKSAAARDAWGVPVTTWLPADGAGPFPTMIYGHGLGGDRKQAEQLAALACPRGLAVVAIDAVKHGSHPDQPSSTDKLVRVLDFFGFALSGPDLLDARRLRDNFRQSSYDKLLLVELLRPGLDVTGDGKPDLGVDRLMYLGVSLGGVMAPEFLAHARDVKVAVPIVPGARVSGIIQDGQMFKVVIDLFRQQATDGDVARFFPLLQTAIDRGDPGVYAPLVLGRADSPQLLVQMVIDDEIVPNSTNRYFARALGVPHVGDALQVVAGLPRGALPARANVDSKHTAGLFQYDVVWRGRGPNTEPATHGNVAANPITVEQTFRFIDSWIKDGVSEIIDPYRTLGVKK